MPYKDPEKARACQRAWYAKNREAEAARKAAYYVANREVVAERVRKYRVANPDKVHEFCAAWQRANPDKANARCRRWQRANREKVRAARSLWGRVNRGKANANTNQRRARKLNATPVWADQDAITEFYKEAARRRIEVDHIVPLQGRIVCGLHVHYNLQLLTKSENSAKGNRFHV